MPSKFGVGLLLFFLTLFSVSFFILGALDVPPVAILFLTLLLTVVGFGQILWPDYPRTASTLGGAMFVPLFSLAILIWERANYRSWLSVAEAAPMVFCIAPVGAMFGYLAGTLLAGIFLKTGFRSPNPLAEQGSLGDGAVTAPRANDPSEGEPALPPADPPPTALGRIEPPTI